MTPIFPVNRFHNVTTPFYYYDTALLKDTLSEIKRASDFPGFCVHYAVKANANPELLKIISAYGMGADTVSGGEIRVAIASGFPASKIVFAGVGKSDEEINLALDERIGCLNVESEAELDVIEEIARTKGVKAPVALRVNPEIDAHTHHYITTGLAENKFGIALSHLPSLLKRVAESPNLTFRGLHFHIGSQITDLEPYKILCERINHLQERYPEIEIPTINVGGGLGIDYDNPDLNPIPDFETYFRIFANHLHLRKGQEVHFELGRAVVAQCGSLISKVLYVKEGVGKRFIILDAGMTDLIRPALYQAHHKIENLTSDSKETETYDVVGPICESSDVFGENEVLPVTHRGDLIALRSAGAYGEAMSSGYNCRKLPGSML